MYNYEKLPTEILQESMERYLEHGIEGGHFLTKVLSNDIAGTIDHADSININLLPDIVKWLYNEVPLECWGSEIKVKAWVDKFKPVEKRQYCN